MKQLLKELVAKAKEGGILKRCDSISGVIPVRCQLKKGHKGFHEHKELFRWKALEDDMKE